MSPSRNHFLLSLYGLISIALILFGLTSSFLKPLGIYDEGFALTNALRILQGEVPHRDYWAAYPPGTSLALAVFFSFFEPTLFVARLVNLGWTILILASIFVLLRHFASTWSSLTATVVASLWVSASLYPSYSVIPALALVFLALALFAKGIAFDNKSIIALGGIIAGCVVLFRHDFSGYLFFSILATLIVTIVKTKSEAARSSTIRSALFFLVLFFLTTLVVLILLLTYSGWGNFIQQAIEFPATGMREYRFLPYPGLLDFFGAWKSQWLLAWLVPGLVFAALCNQWIARANQELSKSMAIYTLAIMSLLLTVQAHNRLDTSHAAPSILFALCFLVSAASSRPLVAQRTYRIVSCGLIAVLFLYSAYAAVDYPSYRNVIECARNRPPQSCMKADESQMQVVEFVNKNFNPTEPVFIGNTRHDKIFVNDASMYFLLGRAIPVKWNEMHPGVVTTRDVQQAIIKQLDERKVNVVVIANMPEPQEKNASAVSSGVHVLDDYIKNNYKPVFSNNRYQVLERWKTG